MWTLALIPLAGLLNRVRGGLWGAQLDTDIAAADGGKKPGTQLARIIFAISMGVLLALAQHNWWLALSAPFWLADEFLPNGDYLGMTSVWQFLEATAVGIGNVLLVVLFMAWVAAGFPGMAAPWYANEYATLLAQMPWFLLGAGALKGVCYLLAKFIPSKIPNFQQGAEMAELLFGLVLGAGVVL